MKRLHTASQTAVALLAGGFLCYGCAGATTTEPIVSQAETTSAAVPTPNGTYDRSLDPRASNAGGGTTEMRRDTEATIALAPPPAGMELLPPADSLTDGQIAAIVADVDAAEIEAGKLAQSLSRNPSVRRFGAQMVSGHTAVEGQLDALLRAENIVPAPSSVDSKLRSDDAARRETMTAKSGSDFDHAYLRGQLQAHRELLELLDARLIPAARDAELKAALEGIRTKVVADIALARAAEASLAAP